MSDQTKPIQEVLYLTDIANSDCTSIIETLNYQGEKLESIKDKNTTTKGILKKTDELTKRIMKRRRVIGVVTAIFLILLASIWIFYKI